MYIELGALNAIPVNRDVTVLTNKDGSGWRLRAGTLVKLYYDMHELHYHEGEPVMIGLIKNDMLHSCYIYFMDRKECKIEIQDDGLYYFCMISEECSDILL